MTVYSYSKYFCEEDGWSKQICYFLLVSVHKAKCTLLGFPRDFTRSQLALPLCLTTKGSGYEDAFAAAQ